jgi:hypothetical protein
LEESLDIVVASVEVELVTLAELASIEFKVDARLCFDALRRSILEGRAGALVPGLRFEDLLLFDAHMRPRKRLAAVVISEPLTGFVVAVLESR